MSTIKFSVVDVFSKTAYQGNPLAVVDDRENALTTAQMQLITRQFNLSETTFVKISQLPGVKYRLRSFLPNGREVSGAGHNSLGAIWWIARTGLLTDIAPKTAADEQVTPEILFDIQIGSQALRVKLVRGDRSNPEDIFVSVRHAPPTLHGKHQSKAALARLTGLEEHEIGLEGLLPQIVSTASSKHLAVPISSVAALQRAVVDRQSILSELQTVDSHAFGLYLFTEDKSVNGKKIIQARFFSPGMSGEDPATGSAAGPLARYLYEYGHLSTSSGVARMAVKQGLAVGRDCLIEVELEKGEHEIDVSIAAHCASVASGEIMVPNSNLIFSN
jgi:trans-2,3-dihydro-3-hydroxyanthranilate isomerase